MSKRVTVAISLGCLAAAANAQSGAQITMPPNARQTGLFSFANQCGSAQTYKASAEPPTDWLRLDPATIAAQPDATFGVRVTVHTTDSHQPGSYRSSLKLVCVSCAASDPPCLQVAKDLPIVLTVANVKVPGEFLPMMEAHAPVTVEKTQAAAPQPITPDTPQPITPDTPQPSRPRLLPWVAFGLSAVGVMGAMVAALSMLNRRAKHRTVRVSGAESERHQVRR
jgi:hypothetical protein